MKKSRKFLYIFMSLIAAMLLCACGNNNNDSSKTEEKDIVLTDRQIQILRENGLPENFDELSLSQKSAISSIETMLSYLEEKYQDTFTFDEYAPAFGIENEWLTAYIKQGESEKIVTVSRTYDGEKFNYKDNYLEVVSKEEYEKAVEEYFHKVLPDSELWVTTLVNHVSDTEGNILAKCNASSLVFMKNIFSSEEEIKKIVEDYANYLLSLGLVQPAGMQLYVQNEEDFFDINQFNYSERIRNEQYVYSYGFDINGDGDISYYGD